jgi:hypothetical protein
MRQRNQGIHAGRNFQKNVAFGTVIIDKAGIVRFHYVSRDEHDRPRTGTVIEELRRLQ